MNNQAAQTMPELQNLPAGIASRLSQAQRDALAQYVTDYGRACYAAALSQTAGVADFHDCKQASNEMAEIHARLLTAADDLLSYAIKRSNRVPAAPAASGGEPPSAASEAYAKANPLGGPATMFDAIANRLRAGEPMAEVLEDYGLRFVGTPAASVSERARELLAAEYRSHGWHEDAGRLCMGGDPTSFVEDDALRVIDRLIEQGDEDAHVITELGRLLACIAVILKGPEPAGTAWSYHDLPELVASALSEPQQVAAEMKAWAHTKMAEQQSSRRDRMMVAEWAKRLLPESSFPVKDFDVEGMSITKEAAREAVKRVALEQALTQRRGEASARIEDLGIHTPMQHGERSDAEQAYSITAHDFEKNPIGSRDWTIYWRGWWHRSQLYATTPQPSADAVRELVRRWRNEFGEFHEAKLDCADELESLLGRAG